MSTVSVTNTFVAGTNAVASAVNTNFADLVSYINTNAILKDGTKTFTVHQPTSAGDPTDPTHLARKAYVDTTTNKMSGQITSLHTTPRSQVATGAYEVVSNQDFVIPATVTEAVTFQIQAAWVLSNNTGASGAGLFKYEICWDLLAATPVYTLLAPATALITTAPVSPATTNSFTINSNDVINNGIPLYASQAAAGKTVRIRLSFFQPTTANGGGLSMWLVTPKTLVTVTREVPFA